jgi:hypothetical protein
VGAVESVNLGKMIAEGVSGTVDVCVPVRVLPQKVEGSFRVVDDN